MTNQGKNARQRDHQANERTFLAWLRTSISLIGFGLAIARFGLFLRQSEVTTTRKIGQYYVLPNSEILGMGLVIIGIIVVGLATLRYNQVYWQIERNRYQPNRIIIWSISGLIILFGTLSLPLLWGKKTSTPKAKPPQHSGYLRK